MASATVRYSCSPACASAHATRSRTRGAHRCRSSAAGEAVSLRPLSRSAASVVSSSSSTIAASSLGLKGFGRKRSASAFSAASRSDAWVRAVRTITGVPDRSGSRRSSVSTSRPLRPGMSMSRMIRSGFVVRAISSDSSPSRASAIRYPRFPKAARTSVRRTSSLSHTSTVAGIWVPCEGAADLPRQGRRPATLSRPPATAKVPLVSNLPHQRPRPIWGTA
jgi:hypothetical protein